MADQIRLDDAARATETERDGVLEVTPDLAYQKLLIVNVAYFGPAGSGDRQWVLIDAGIPGETHNIIAAAERWSCPISMVARNAHRRTRAWVAG